MIKRDKTTKEAVMNRIENQWSDSKRNMLSNYVIWNFEKGETLLKIKKIHKNLTKKQTAF